MKTNTFNTFAPSCSCANGMSTRLKSFTAEQTKAASISSQKSLDVDLVTAEGDKVSISLDAKMAALYGSYEKDVMNDQGYAHQQTEVAFVLYERNMTFTVEGDLSDDELKDIHKALKSLDRMMNHYVNGDLKPALAKADKIAGLDTISELNATMSYQREVIRAEQTQITAVTETPVAGAISADEPAIAATPLMQMAEKADAVGQAMAEKMKAHKARLDKMVAFFEQLMEDYRNRMQGLNKLGSQMVDRIAAKVTNSLLDGRGAEHDDEQGQGII